MNNIIIRFQATSAYGNNAYVDDIVLSSATSGVSDMDAKDRISVFPNPASDFFNISNASGCLYSVYNISGAVVLKSKITSNLEKIDISSLPQGMYMIFVNSDKESKSFKLNLIK